LHLYTRTEFSGIRQLMHDKKSDVFVGNIYNQEASKLECKCSLGMGRANSVVQDTACPSLFVFVATFWVLSLIGLAIAIVGLAYTTQLPPIVPMSGINLPNAYGSRMSIESYRERFGRELFPIVAKLDTTEAKVLAIL
jgi:hypothetical protein